MTSIVAVMRRTYTLSMFADLTTVPHERVRDPLTNLTTLTFAGTLDASTVAAIRARMTSRNDDDQACRAALCADRDALTANDPLRRLYDYVLGD